MVECDLAKVEVAGSNPVSRSRHFAALAFAFSHAWRGFLASLLNRGAVPKR